VAAEDLTIRIRFPRWLGGFDAAQHPGFFEKPQASSIVMTS
jgi:hypothetical protein